MNYIESLIQEFRTYMPPLTKRPDFDVFWRNLIEKSSQKNLNSQKKLIEYPIPYVSVYDIIYDGEDGTPIHGWFILPVKNSDSKLPCIIHYHGFGDNRGLPFEFMYWVMMGFAVISIDCREQLGDTGTMSGYSGGYVENVMCKGILNKDEYYLKHLYIDCVRAVDYACMQPEVDAEKIVIEGGSQGGGLGIAVCALDERPIMALVDVPSFSNIEKRIEGEHGSFKSVAEYLRRFPGRLDNVFETLSYFDTINMADKIKSNVFASVGLKDEICPPEMFFATYNRIRSRKEIYVYPFSGHEGGGREHEEKKIIYLKNNM